MTIYDLTTQPEMWVLMDKSREIFRRLDAMKLVTPEDREIERLEREAIETE